MRILYETERYPAVFCGVLLYLSDIYSVTVSFFAPKNQDFFVVP